MAESYTIRCPLHRKESVLYTCTQSQCTRQPTVCAACPDTHSDHHHSLVAFADWVFKVSRTVEEGAKYQNYLKDSLQDFDQLLKWCEDDEMHLRKVEQHCYAQKSLIAEDLIVAREIFSEKCCAIQLAMDSQLDEFLTVYKESFKQCKLTIEDSYQYRNYAAYTNPNNLLFRLQQSTSKEAYEVTQGLKRMSQRVRQIEQDKSGFTEGLRTISQKVSFMTDNLPVYQFQEGLDNICSRLVEELQQHLTTKMKIRYHSEREQPQSALKENKMQKQYSQPIATNHNRVISKQHSMPPDNVQKSPKKESAVPQISNAISSTNKNLQLLSNSNLNASDLTFKPLKKYQLDFIVSAIEVISDTLFALACSNDPYMRMFDTVQKRIHTLQAHGSPIQCIQKWIDSSQQVLSPLQPHNGGRAVNKAPYLFSLSTDAIIVWTFDMTTGSTMSTVPHIQHKYLLPNQGSISQICSLQDNLCLLLGDKEGGVEVYNYHTQKVQQACLRGKHTKAINSIILYKRYDKALIASADQCLSVWRLLYHNQNAVFENAYCESVVNVGQGSISNLSLLQTNPNLLLLTSSNGTICLFNLVNQTVTLCSESTKNLIIDYLVVEDSVPRKQGQQESFCMIAQGQGTKSLRFWRAAHKDDGWTQTEQKVDVAITPTDSLMGPKLQFVHMLQNSTNPLVLIANDTNKELLVYEIVTK